jgi:hypothetical protein
MRASGLIRRAVGLGVQRGGDQDTDRTRSHSTSGGDNEMEHGAKHPLLREAGAKTSLRAT